MYTFIKMAFRNIFRAKRRSIIVILTIAIGLWGLIVSNAYYDGMIQQMVKSAIEIDSGHIQIHKFGFQEKMLINLVLPDPKKVASSIKNLKDVKSFSPRVRGNGLAQTAEYSSGVMILGIDPFKEQDITSVKGNLVDGEYLDQAPQNSVLVGKAFAKKFNLELGEKLIIMVQDSKNEIGSAAFRVCGFFQSASTDFDKFAIFIDLKAAQKLYSLGNNLSEYVITLENSDQIQQAKQILKKELGQEYEVIDWKEIMPVLVEMQVMMDFWTYLSYIVVFLAVAIGIINILLMSIFERIREFGVMKALGTSPSKLVFMILMESVIIGFLGLVLGGVFSYATGYYFMERGIDLTAFSKGLEYFGFSPIVYPVFTPGNIITAIVAVIITTVVAAIWPAIKAARLVPTEAIRFI